MKTLTTILTIILSLNAYSQNLNSNQTELKLRYEVEDETRTLYWNTNKEVNTSCFIIERKLSNQSFEIIDIVKAKGYSTVSQEYELDLFENTNDLVTYKISLVEMGGEISTSVISEFNQNDQLAADSIVVMQ